MTFVFEILKTDEFDQWYRLQMVKTKVIIDARLQRIAIDSLRRK